MLEKILILQLKKNKNLGTKALTKIFPFLIDRLLLLLNSIQMGLIFKVRN